VVAITALSIYLQPLNQAVARACFIVLHRRKAQQGAPQGCPEATALLYADGLLMLALSVAIPLAFLPAGSDARLELGLYFLNCVLTNLWSYEIQSSLWAVGITTAFEVHSVPRRILLFATLPVMWLTQDFLLFVVLVNAVCAGSLLVMCWQARRTTPVFSPRELTKFPRASLPVMARTMGSSLVSTLPDLALLSSPYGLFMIFFGVGPAVVVYDTIMKVVRIALVVGRIFSEVILPRQADAQIEGDRTRSKRLLGWAVAATLAGNGVLAAIFALAGPYLFHLLLGPNDVMPPGAALITAALVLLTVPYQPAVLLLSYSGLATPVRWMTAAALVGVAGFVGFLALGQPALMPALWAYVALFGLVAAVTGALALGSLGRSAPVTWKAPART
jgi:O-antigen/teichoic acid export membrane protein